MKDNLFRHNVDFYQKHKFSILRAGGTSPPCVLKERAG
jgi:hypothetical protein